ARRFSVLGRPQTVGGRPTPATARRPARKANPMLNYLLRRFIYMVLLVTVLSILTFAIVQLPAGDFVNTLAKQAQTSGKTVDQTRLNNLRHQFGLDQPVYIQYLRWAGNVLRGDLGWSFQFKKPVAEVIG